MPCAMAAGKAVAADSDSEDEEDDDSSIDGSPAKSRPLTAPTNMGGPLSGGLTIPATMHDPGESVLMSLHRFTHMQQSTRISIYFARDLTGYSPCSSPSLMHVELANSMPADIKVLIVDEMCTHGTDDTGLMRIP